MKLTQFDYDWLKGQWDDIKGAAYNTVGKDLYEAGMIDDFGFVTPKGKKAIEEYEINQRIFASYGPLDVRDDG